MSALAQSVKNQRQVHLLQVAHAAVDEFGAAAGGLLGEIGALHKERAVAASGGFDCGTQTGRPTANHQDVPRLRIDAELPQNFAARVHACTSFPDDVKQHEAYSIFGIAVDRKHIPKWLFPLRGPLRQVFVAGVEVKATFHGSQKVYMYSENAQRRESGNDACRSRPRPVLALGHAAMRERAQPGIQPFGQSRILLERCARAQTGQAQHVGKCGIGERKS